MEERIGQKDSVNCVIVLLSSPNGQKSAVDKQRRPGCLRIAHFVVYDRVRG
jgi:hypothetical protein